jgi:hypothetical protein
MADLDRSLNAERFRRRALKRRLTEELLLRPRLENQETAPPSRERQALKTIGEILRERVRERSESAPTSVRLAWI